MRAALAVVRVGALHAFAWRLDVVHALLSAGIVGAVSVSLWSAVAQGQGQVGTLPGPQVAAYAAVAWIVSRVTGTRLDENLGQRVASGQIAADLLKPVDPLAWLLLRDLGRALAAAAVVGLPLLGTAWVLGQGVGPASPEAAALGLVSLALGVRLGGLVGVLVGLASVSLRRVSGLVSLKEVGLSLASGALVPLPILPATWAPFFLLSPFAGLAHAPAMLWLGAVDRAQALAWLLGQGLWVLVAEGLVRAAWASARPRLVLEGG